LQFVILFSSCHQQQADLPSEQPQEGSVFRNIPFKIPAAHPTPDLTYIACRGQFNMHAPHSIHLSRFTMCAFLSVNSKTACGHTFVHMPQPLHFSSSNCRVTTFFKYTKSFMALSFVLCPRIKIKEPRLLICKSVNLLTHPEHPSGEGKFQTFSLPIVINTSPVTAKAICSGTATLISFFTPESEV
jgi:hypothetical protein